MFSFTNSISRCLFYHNFNIPFVFSTVGVMSTPETWHLKNNNNIINNQPTLVLDFFIYLSGLIRYHAGKLHRYHVQMYRFIPRIIYNTVLTSWVAWQEIMHASEVKKLTILVLDDMRNEPLPYYLRTSYYQLLSRFIFYFI